MKLRARHDQRSVLETPTTAGEWLHAQNVNTQVVLERASIAAGEWLHAQNVKTEMVLERASIAAGASLLHNMSCRPNTAVTHTGVDQCHRICILSELTPTPNLLFTELCATFGVDMPEDGDGWKALTNAANLPCPELMLLPPVAAVLANAPGKVFPGISDNPRLVLAVLARCSGGIFIRDRPPVITSDQMKKTVTLIAPLSWKAPS